MKHIQVFVAAAICTVVLAFATTASAQTVKQGVVTIVRIKGDARYSAGDNVWHALKPGMTVGSGDVIQTGADSSLDIVLSDKSAQVSLRSNAGMPIGGALPIAGLPVKPLQGRPAALEQNVIRLQANTVLAVDKFIYSQTGADTVTDTELDLRSGKIFGNIKKISAASKYIIKTPNGVAGIRGTAFLLGADGDVTVLQGSVVISQIGTNGQVFTSVLSAGEEYNPQTGKVFRPTPAQFVAAVLEAKALVIAINATVTVVETPTANGSDTTTVVVSPTTGRHT